MFLSPQRPSLVVLRSWHDLHKAWRLLSAQNNSRFPLWGTIWSTTVAGVILPCCSHSTQSGCSNRTFFRNRCQREVLYSCLEYLGRSYLLYCRWYSCRCLGQNRASVSSGQPGWRQGASGFLGNGLHLPLTVLTAGPGDPFMFVTVFGYVN